MRSMESNTPRAGPRPSSRRSFVVGTATTLCLLGATDRLLAQGSPATAAKTPGGEPGAGGVPPALAFLGFELVDDHPAPENAAGLKTRLSLIERDMAAGLAARNLYRVVDIGPARASIEKLRNQVQFLYSCNDCLGPIGKDLGLRLVATGWVQRVSSLILNINLQITDVVDNRMALTKSVDIRGDNDTAWQRGVAFMLRDMTERRNLQPRYGL